MSAVTNFMRNNFSPVLALSAGLALVVACNKDPDVGPGPSKPTTPTDPTTPTSLTITQATIVAGNSGLIGSIYEPGKTFPAAQNISVGASLGTSNAGIGFTMDPINPNIGNNEGKVESVDLTAADDASFTLGAPDNSGRRSAYIKAQDDKYFSMKCTFTKVQENVPKEITFRFKEYKNNAATVSGQTLEGHKSTLTNLVKGEDNGKFYCSPVIYAPGSIARAVPQ